MHPVIWSMLLLAFGLALAMLEVFIPSAGILGFLSLSAIVTAIVLAFSLSGTTAGFLFLGIAAVSLPATVMVAFKWLPGTPFGRRLMLGMPKEKEVLPDDDPRIAFESLIGCQGTAKSAMLPGGTISIDGVTYEAVSASGAIDAGDMVTVARIRNNRLVVQKGKTMTPDSTTTAPIEDPLSKPIDALGIDPLDDLLS
tara:strand:- start:1937 stop:2527 length:591 start_codon:yes stop_codon:yes gene_type:complete